MLTGSNALLMSSATVIVRSGGLFWLKSVAMVLFMLCSVPKRHSMHEVGMQQTSVQIVSTQPCPQRWGPIKFFGQADRRSLPHGWL